MRITRVYTKSGDAGETSLVDGTRVKKSDARVTAYGEVDELNSWLGLIRVGLNDPQLDQALEKIQNELFIVGADLASPMTIQVPRIDEEQVGSLETLIDQLLEELEPLQEFILPGGSEAAAMLHVARTIARRAERHIVTLASEAEINSQAIIYLNRMSDLLFVMARIVNKRAGVKDISASFSDRGRKS